MPGPLEVVSSLGRACQVAKATKNLPLKDLLNEQVSQYNKTVSNKKHRIDQHKKNLALNLCLDRCIILLS